MDRGELDRGEEGGPVQEKPNSAPKRRACLPPPGGLRRARTAEETPSIQRARQLELQRLDIEKKELQAQLAEVKQLMRASKVRAKAMSVAGETLAAAAVAGPPAETRGRALARRSRSASGGRREERRRGSMAPSTEGAAAAPCDLEKAGPRWRGEKELAERGRDRPAAGDARVGCDNARPVQETGEGDGSSRRRRRRRRRKRKRSSERGRSQSRKRQPQALGRRSTTPDNKAGKRRNLDRSPTTLVAFNTCVSVNTPAAAGWVQGVSSPRGENLACAGGGDTGTRRLRRPRSASRRLRSVPRPSPMERSGLVPTDRGDRQAINGLVERAKPDHHSSSRRGRARRLVSDRPRSRASRNRKDVGCLAAGKGRGNSQDSGKRRVYFARFSATDQAKTRAAVSPSAEGAEKSYEGDLEVVSARDSYESDFEPWGDSESPHGLSEGERILAPDSSRRPGGSRGSGIAREGSGTWRDRENSAVSSRGGDGVDSGADSFFRDGEEWVDGQQHGLNSPVNDGGAASWAEWNQPDDGSGFASSRGLGTRDREAAATHPSSRKGTRGFDHLWVDGCDNVLGARAEEDSDEAAGPHDAREGPRRKLDGSLSSSYEDYSAETAGGPPSLACPPGLVDGGHDNRGHGALAGGRGRASTASMSDGGASLFDIPLSSRDDSYSDETWSLESHDHDRRIDTATPAELSTTAAARGPGPRAKRRHSAAAGASSDGSSLYDVASQSSEGAPTPRSKGNPPRPGDETTADGAAASGGSGIPTRHVVAAEDEISAERASDASNIPSDEVAASGEGLRTWSGPLTGSSGAEKQLLDSNESSFDHLLLGTSPSRVLIAENDPVDQKGKSHVTRESIDRLPAGGGEEAPVNDNLHGSGESVERGHGRVMDNKQAEREESLDELSSLEKSDRTHVVEPEGSADRSLGGGGGEASVDEYFHGSADSIETGFGHAVDNKQADSGESLDELSSLDKQGAVNREKLKEGVGSVEYFNGSAENVETGKGHMADSKQVEPEESYDELSSLDKQGEARVMDDQLNQREGSADRSVVGGGQEASVDEYLHGSGQGAEMRHGRVMDRKQAEPGESLDELSSLDKQGEANRERLEEEGASVDEFFNGSGENVEMGGQDHVASSKQVEPEESFDEISSLDKQGEARVVDDQLNQREGSADRSVVEGGREASADEYSHGISESIEMGQDRVAEGQQAEPEESLDELSSIEKQGRTHVEEPEGSAERSLAGGGREAFADEFLNVSADSIEIGQDHVADSKQAEPGESLDELSSLDKQDEADSDKLEEGGASVDEFFNGSGENTEMGQGHVADSKEAEPEESLDELSSLEKHGETNREQSERGEAPADEYFTRSVATVETGQSHGMDNKQAKLEGSLDELSSLEKQGVASFVENKVLQPEGSADRSLGGGERRAPVGEFLHRSEESTYVGPGAAMDNKHTELVESFDELSSLEKPGRTHVVDSKLLHLEGSADRSLAGGGGEVSADEYFHGGAASIEIGYEESLDELSSLEKQGEAHVVDNKLLQPEVSADRSPAGGGREAPVDEYLHGSAESVAMGHGHVIDSKQVEPEESLDELSSLEKRGEANRERLEEGGESVDEYLNGSAEVTGLAQWRSSQLEAEEPIEQLGSPAKLVLFGNRIGQDQQQQQQQQQQEQQQGAAVDINGANHQFLRASGNEPFEPASAAQPAIGKDESLDEYLFEGGTDSYEDLLSLSGSSFGAGRARGGEGEGGTAADGDGSSSIGIHSLDQSFGAISSSGGGSPSLSDRVSLGESVMSDFELGGSSSGGAAKTASSWEIP